MSKSVASNDRFLRLNKKVCHISKIRAPSIASAISHLSEIVGSPLLYHHCGVLICLNFNAIIAFLY